MSHNIEYDNRKKYDWLVIFFVHEIYGDLDIIRERIEAIEKNGMSANSVFFLIKDSVSLGEDGKVSFFLSVEKLERDSCGFKFLQVNDLYIDNADRHCWEAAFSYIFSKVQAERKMLFTLSHGAAFGINVEHDGSVRPKYPGIVNGKEYYNYSNRIADASFKIHFLDQQEYQKILNASANKKNKVPVSVNFGYIVRSGRTNLCRNLELIWISELSEVLGRLLKETKIDICLMANCYMQSFDAGYVLRNNIEYLIAPEGQISSLGYDYVKILKYISDPGVSTKWLARQIILDIPEFYIANNESLFLSSIAVFANKLEYYDKAVLLFNEFLSILDNNLENIIKPLSAIREQMVLYVSFRPGNYAAQNLDMIDIYNWINLVFKSFPTLFDSTNMSSRFENLRSEILEAGYVGDSLIVHDMYPDYPKFGFNGISIFFPKNSDMQDLDPLPWCAFFSKKGISSFRRNSFWQLFLQRYFALLSKK